jgi:hypothetical protein
VRLLLFLYRDHYKGARTHSSLNKDASVSRAILAVGRISRHPHSADFTICISSKGRAMELIPGSTCWKAPVFAFVDATGRIARETKVLSEPEDLITWFSSLGLKIIRIGLEAGLLSQWFYAAMKQAGLSAELRETRHVRDAFKAMPVKHPAKPS